MRSRVLPVLLALLASAACAGSKSDQVRTSVRVSEREYEIATAIARAAPGRVSFVVTNRGVEDHEMVVVRTDLAPGALPVEANGSVDEKKLASLGEVEDLKPGKTRALDLPLEAGSYVLFCNVVEGGDVHYQRGMRTAFTVR